MTFPFSAGKEKKNMFDSIPQCSALQDVAPGDIWQPESAARYNAVNDLLRQEPDNIVRQMPVTGSDCTITVCNVTDKELPIYSAVQLDTTFVPENILLWHRHVCAYGRPVENEYSVWGVALETIRPGQAGLVQISGAAIIRYPRGKYEGVRYNSNYVNGETRFRNGLIFAGRDGHYHFGQRGGAEVIWYCYDTGWTLVRLGVRENRYTGMFSVIENGDRTLTVKGGVTDLTDFRKPMLTMQEGNYAVNDKVFNIEGKGSGSGRIIILQATWQKSANANWNIELLSVKNITEENYIPGEKIFWEIARYDSVDEYGYLEGFEQLWQGGKINFRDRYYIEQ